MLRYCGGSRANGAFSNETFKGDFKNFASSDLNRIKSAEDIKNIISEATGQCRARPTIFDIKKQKKLNVSDSCRAKQGMAS